MSSLQYDVRYWELASWPGRDPVDSNSLRFQNPPEIAVTFVGMNQWPENTLDAVESQTRMITRVPTSTAVTAVAELMRTARAGLMRNTTLFPERLVAGGPAAIVFAEKLRGVLPEEVVARFRIVDSPSTDVGAIRRLEIQVHRVPPRDGEKTPSSTTDASLEISLVATGELKEGALPDGDDAAVSGNESRPSGRAASDMLTTETVRLAPRNLPAGDLLVFLLPSPFEVESLVAFAALIEVKPPPQEGTHEAAAYARMLRECRDLLAAAELDDHQDERRFAGGRRGIEDAVRLLQSPTHRRRALLHLAQEAAAPLAKDVALSVNSTVVDGLAVAIANEYMADFSLDTNMWGWRLERMTYLFMVELLSREQTPPDLEAILIRHTGEVGRHPSVLKEMVTDAVSMEALGQRLLLENFIYLEDISPAARARAFEWLAARGQAPEGYDPLASLQERRSILNRVLQEQP